MNPHWALFEQFARAELASGGPDPQVRLTAEATRQMHWRRSAVAAGWFVVPYTVGAAAALWAADLWDADEAVLRDWLVTHADGLPTRRERRSIWGESKVKFARSLTSWRDWVERRLTSLPSAGFRSYAELYTSINDEVAYFGRYATMKVVEVLFQAGLTQLGQSDIRARGAKYPRKMLALLWPEHAPVLNVRGDPAATVQLAENLALDLQVFLDETTEFDVSMFQVETILCNSRQALNGKYPGRSHDRELAHWVRAERYWGRDYLLRAIPFYDLRWQLFPHEHLGERGTPPWWAARQELEEAQMRLNKEVLGA